MCLATLYETKNLDLPILKDVARITWNPDHIEVVTLYGEKRMISGKIEQIDFMKSTITLAQDQSVSQSTAVPGD